MLKRSWMNLALCVCIFSLAFASGCCCPSAPSNSVTIKVNGTVTTQQFDQLKADAEQQVGDVSYHSSGIFNGEASLTYAPVDDVQEFADGIDYATVTKVDVENKTIYVDLKPATTTDPPNTESSGS